MLTEKGGLAAPFLSKLAHLTFHLTGLLSKIMLKVQGMQNLKVSPNMVQLSYIGGVHVDGVCPHCGNRSNFTKMLFLDESQMHALRKIGPEPKFSSVWACNGCNGFVYVEYDVLQFSTGGNTRIHAPRVINRQKISFDYTFVPDEVSSALKEACDCFSVASYNGFAAMCRRAVEALCDDKGADENSRLKSKVKELKELAGIEGDSDDGQLLDSVVLTGHDGSHFYLPKVDEERAELLFQFMGDILEQMYNRQGRIKKAQEVRKERIKSIKQAI